MGRDVTEHECAKMREYAWRGRIRSWIGAQFDVTGYVLRYHVRGDCSHEPDIPPINWADPDASNQYDGRTVPTLADFE